MPLNKFLKKLYNNKNIIIILGALLLLLIIVCIIVIYNNNNNKIYEKFLVSAPYISVNNIKKIKFSCNSNLSLLIVLVYDDQGNIIDLTDPNIGSASQLPNGLASNAIYNNSWFSNRKLSLAVNTSNNGDITQLQSNYNYSSTYIYGINPTPINTPSSWTYSFNNPQTISGIEVMTKSRPSQDLILELIDDNNTVKTGIYNNNYYKVFTIDNPSNYDPSLSNNPNYVQMTPLPLPTTTPPATTPPATTPPATTPPATTPPATTPPATTPPETTPPATTPPETTSPETTPPATTPPETTSPETTPPATTYPSTTYPSTTYPSTTYPTTTYPSTTYPTTTYPTTTYPSTTYPSTTYPSTTYPSTTYPATTYPSTTYPSTTYPATTYPASTLAKNTSPQYTHNSKMYIKCNYNKNRSNCNYNWKFNT